MKKFEVTISLVLESSSLEEAENMANDLRLYHPLRNGGNELDFDIERVKEIEANPLLNRFTVLSETSNFDRLAELLLQIILEGGAYDVPDDFKMPKEAIARTVAGLKNGYLGGAYKEDETGALYYSGMTEDYGGFYHEVLDKLFQDDSVTVFNKAAAAFAKAAEELDIAWDQIVHSNDPEVSEAMDLIKKVGNSSIMRFITV